MKTPPGPHVLLAGFSGSGKTTVLREIERLLPEKACLDLDQLVMAGQGSVAAIVDKEGWSGFRARELAQLKQVLARPDRTVVALGGGTLEQGWAVIDQSKVKVVHLDCPFETCWQRISRGTERPLVQLGEAALSKLFEERKPLYHRCSLRVDATGSPDEVALAILRLTGLA
jgi:shikimate kinase